MLIKHGSPIARKAAFPAPKPPPVEDMETVQPSEQDVAIAELTRNNEALRNELARLRANWADELALAERQAREAAARDHIRDDARRFEMLASALADARHQFETNLIALAERSATELALVAMVKLFDVRASDADLLARVISRRLADLDEKAIVELQLSPGDADGAVGSEVAAALPPGARIVTDSALPAGTARVQLRLGSAFIDPVEGFERLRAVLAEGGDHA